MIKKDYQKPAIRVVATNMSHHLLVGTEVKNVGGGVFDSQVKAGDASTVARSRGSDVWGDSDDED